MNGKKMKGSVDGEPVDRLSRMPKDLIHKIMLLLPPRDLARTSVLSKTFLSLFRSFPILDLDFDRFFESRLRSYSRRYWGTELFDFVQNSIRFHDFGENSLERLSFSHRNYLIGSLDDDKFRIEASRVEAAIRLLAKFALSSRAREVVLDFSASQVKPPSLCRDFLGSRFITTMSLTSLSLTDIVFDCPSLENLDLSGCRCECVKLAGRRLKTVKILKCIGLKRIEIDPATAARLESFTFHKYLNSDFEEVAGLASCSALKVLQLGLGDSQWFKGGVSAYADLETLVLIDCDALTRVWGRNLSLKTLELKGCKAVKRIDVVAPNLKDLRLDGVGLRALSRQFVLLESLALESCSSIKEMVVLSSDSLRRLKIKNCKMQGVVEIDAPNLISFDYEGSILPNLIIKSVKVKANLTLNWVGYDELNVLTKFLSHFGHPKNLTLNSTSSESLMFPWHVRGSLLSPLYDLQHLSVRLTRNAIQNFTEFVDSLLWLAPNPKTITMALGWDRNVRLVFHYSNGWEQHEEDEEDGLFCCLSKPIKCWKHHLDSVDLETFKGFRDESNLRSYLRMHANATLTLK